MVCEHRAGLLARANVLFEDATLRSACRAQSAIARVLPRVALRSGAVDPIAQTGETFVQPAPEGDSSFNAGIDIDRAEFADVFLPRLAIDAACGATVREDGDLRRRRFPRHNGWCEDDPGDGLNPRRVARFSRG
jgi:hypothetical protein